ncbi:hypothetical protein H312_02588 [Anncaliia algerae PRA339]|uniref:Uncharacterized protein n=1 Tax=Anncaliia algerae PRA339 TaxID=1288291 RepID=A0A059EYR8_9MICR|nr:hypothetical protein H312_02588 [Anncaliia algerae PRA339]
MRRLNLKQNDIIRKMNHLNIKKVLHKEKGDFINDAKQIAQHYAKYVHNPNFKYFIKYLVENLAVECDAATVNDVANNLKRIFSYKVNEKKEEKEYEILNIE